MGLSYGRPKICLIRQSRKNYLEQKVKRCSKIGEDLKSLISTFAYSFTAITKVYFNLKVKFH